MKIGAWMVLADLVVPGASLRAERADTSKHRRMVLGARIYKQARLSRATDRPMNMLSGLDLTGLGVAKDPAQATAWAERAALAR